MVENKNEKQLYVDVMVTIAKTKETKKEQYQYISRIINNLAEKIILKNYDYNILEQNASAWVLILKDFTTHIEIKNIQSINRHQQRYEEYKQEINNIKNLLEIFRKQINKIVFNSNDPNNTIETTRVFSELLVECDALSNAVWIFTNSHQPT